jgi:hypothetical protein
MSGELTKGPTLRELAPALWQNVFAGMSLQDVRRARPDSVPAKSVATLADGATAELVIPHFVLGGQEYTVQFFFLKNALSQVTLTLESSAHIASSWELVTLLRAKYGSELRLSEPDDSSFMRKLEADWISGNGVNISVVCMEGVCLNLNYQVRMVGELNKV